MERRNFFKALFAAGMVVTLPKFEVGAEPPVVENIAAPKAVQVSRASNVSNIYKGTIWHKGKIIANFNEVEINTSREYLDVSDYYTGYAYRAIPGRMETRITALVLDADDELCRLAFVDDTPVEISISADENTIIRAEAFISSMQFFNDFTQYPYKEWEMRLSGMMNIEQTHGG